MKTLVGTPDPPEPQHSVQVLVSCTSSSNSHVALTASTTILNYVMGGTNE